VLVFNRRGRCQTLGCSVVAGDRRDVAALSTVFTTFRPDVGIDMIPFSRLDAEGLVTASGGRCTRLISVSSIDVYAAYGRLHRTELGPVLDGSITEESPLRTKVAKDGAAYDKLAVEDVMARQPRSAVSILRLPMVYGPPDMRRVGSYVKRMLDQRPHIALGRSFAQWRVSRAAARDCAEIIALCAFAEHRGCRIFNVAENEAYSEREWVDRIAGCMKWQGQIKELDDSVCPPPHGIDTRQNMIVSSQKIRSQLGFHETQHPDSSLADAVRWAAESLASGRHHEVVDYEEEDHMLKNA
jgi:nucleoside-diphosphate-sugar epimerase